MRIISESVLMLLAQNYKKSIQFFINETQLYQFNQHSMYLYDKSSDAQQIM